MFEAADRTDWNHTAATIATIVGLVDKRSTIERYHPYAKKKKPGIRLTSDVLLGLKGRFPDAQS
jgi:hypothetical protein